VEAAAPTLVTVDSVDGLAEHGLFCVKNRKHPGYVAKRTWLERAFLLGTRLELAYDGDGALAGFLESAPGEHTWRALDAPGHLVVHCLWVRARGVTTRGVASALLTACAQDAELRGMRGVAVLSGDGPWMAGPAVFLKNGFAVVARAEPTFQLLSRPLAPGPPPSLPADWGERARRFQGLTLVYTNQCPFIGKAVEELPPVARAYGAELHLRELRDPAEARRLMPSPYGVISLVHQGRVLADHPISATRFRNILERDLGLTPRGC